MESDEKIAEMRRILTEELPDDNYFIVKYVVYFLTEVTFIGADFRFEVPGQSSVRLIGGGRGQWLGGTMASAEHEPIMGVWGQSPQRGPGAVPLVRGTKPPWSWKHFGHWMSNGAGKFSPFSQI